MSAVRNPSDSADTAADSPAGPPPTIDQVVDPGPGASACTQRIRDFDVGRINEHATVFDDDDRSDAWVDPRNVQDRCTSLGVCGVEVERHVVPLQEVAYLVHPRRSFGADDCVLRRNADRECATTHPRVR